MGDYPLHLTLQAFHALRGVGDYPVHLTLQAFHALRGVDEFGYLELLRHSLRPGGLLMVLTGMGSGG